MPIAAGRRLGPYEVLASIGAGGMGEVYRAHDTRLGRDVALKVLPSDRSGDPDRRRRFEQEAQALAALSHPQILAIHDVGSEDDVFYVVFELLNGETLRDLLEHGPLPVRKAVEYGVQICRGLAAAHARGVLHRDIKPDNLFLTADGQVKILDFGLAKLSEPEVMPEAATCSATAAGVVLGTVGYMAPEQVRGRRADVRSDIFSLGAVLYEMLSGRRAFDGDTSADRQSAILNHDPPEITSRAGLVLPGLQRVVRRCLEKNPDERFQTARDLGFALESLSGSSGPATEPMSASAGEWRWRSLGLALLLVLLVAGGWVWLGGWAGLSRAHGGRANRIESVAVLPLQNLSGDSEQEYFADGMTDALIADLAKISALKVISRTSAMQYRGTKKTLPEIARALNVDAVVEGSVVRSGGRVRITAQLIDGATDRHLWSESYDRELRDVLTVQGDVVKAITEQIQIKVTPQERARLESARPPPPPEAHELYLKGRYLWNKRTEEDLKKATEYFQQAIERDPGYAAAYSGVADAYFYRGYAFGSLPPREAMPKAKAAAEQALAIDDTLAEAHTSLALVHLFYDWDWPGTEREFKRAIALNPSYATAHHIYAVYLGAVRGQADESVAEAKRALAVDPLSLPINNIVGMMLYGAGRYDEGIEQYRKTLEMEPAKAFGTLVDLYQAKGMYKEAVEQSLRAKVLAGESAETVSALRKAYAASGLRGFREKELELARKNWNGSHWATTDIASLCAKLGRKDEALRWLEKAYEARSGSLVWLNFGSFFEGLRSDLRFQELLRRIGLPDRSPRRTPSAMAH